MQLNSPRDKPIELIDGDELIELLTTHSLLTTGNEGLSPTQTTSTLLRNQIAGISEKFQNQFVQIDTRLILDRRSFGDDHQMSTYKSFGEWTSKIELRFHEQTHGAQTVSRELLQFQSSGPSNYADSQQIRKQLDELFQHGLALYEDVQRAAVPSVAAKYHRILKEMIREHIVHYIDFVKKSEEILENGGNLIPYDEPLQRVGELKEAIDETQSGIRDAFRGRGYNHRIRKFSNGQFRCSCGLGSPTGRRRGRISLEDRSQVPR